MSPGEFAMWGLAGGLLVELLELAARTRAHKTFPWLVPNEMSLGAYIYCALTRPAAGAIVAVALGMTDQITGPWGLLVVGAGAPLIIQNAMRQPTRVADEVPVPGTVVAEEGEGGDGPVDDMDVARPLESQQDGQP
jgi:hypothetical protein